MNYYFIFFNSLNGQSSAKTARKSIKLLKYIKLPKLLRLGQLVRKCKKYQKYQGATTILFIIKQGEYGKELFIIAKGSVLVYDSSINENKQKSLLILKDGAFIGEIASVLELKRTRTVRAITVCETCILDKKSFENIIQHYPEFAYKCIQLMER